VNLGRHHYHFGDYYDVAYARRGYVPWVDYRIRQTAFDPIFSYYRWSHRDQPRWETDVRAVFVDRREHQNARPPRTFALQEKLAVKDPRRAVASFAQAKTAGVRLAAVSKAQVVEFQKTAVEVRKISTSRRTIETSTHAVSPKTARTEPLKLDLPKSSIAHPKAKQAPPAEPDTPKVQDVHKDKTFKEKLPKVDPPKDKEKLPKVDPPKGKDKEKLPKVDPPKEKEKLPKVDPPKEKLPKVEPPKEKEKLPKVDPPKEKLPKVDPPKEKEKLPKVEPPKDDSPKKKDKQSKDSAAVFPPEPVEHPRLSRWEVVRREVVLATDEAWSRGGWGIVALH
jgi:hypothetical protein